MSLPLLSGEVVDTDSELNSLRDEVERLEGELRQARAELNKARAENLANSSAIAALRQQLSPLHRALRAVFGEINLADHDGSPSYAAAPTPVNGSRAAAAWDLWKQKLPGFPSRMIDALLEHGELSVSQLVVAAHCARKQTIYDTASKLTRLGLLRKNDDKYALVEL